MLNEVQRCWRLPKIDQAARFELTSSSASESRVGN